MGKRSLSEVLVMSVTAMLNVSVSQRLKQEKAAPFVFLPLGRFARQVMRVAVEVLSVSVNRGVA